MTLNRVSTVVLVGSARRPRAVPLSAPIPAGWDWTTAMGSEGGGDDGGCVSAPKLARPANRPVEHALIKPLLVMRVYVYPGMLVANYFILTILLNPRAGASPLSPAVQLLTLFLESLHDVPQRIHGLSDTGRFPDVDG
jgi:hypothetical protein